MRLEDLNPNQQEAVKYMDSPLLVLAGAGSGKTRVITNKAIYLIDKYGMDLDRILAITFTNKAAKEMAKRVSESLNLEKDPKWITTFHSMCAKILRYDAVHVGYERDFVIYDENESTRTLRNALHAYNLTSDLYNPDTIKEFISQVKQNLNIKLLDFYKQDIPMFTEIFYLYQKLLRASNAMDFDDLLGFTVKLFRTNMTALAKWQKSFDYILVDEYQDTNKAQHEIMKFILGESKKITLVGDPQQCIYTWRGAHPDNILEFEKEFPDGKVVRLERNYRSSKSILDVANVVIGKSSGSWKDKVLSLWTEQDHGEDIILREFYDREKEAWSVAQEIQKLKAIYKYSYNDFAVLVRLTFLTRHMEDAFMRLRIPYEVIGGLKFGMRKEIKDLVSYLTLVHNPRDEQAFERIINVPSRGMGDKAVAKIKESDKPFYIDKMKDALPKLSKKQQEAVEKLISVLEFVTPRANEHPHDVLVYIYNAVGYETYLREKFKQDAYDRIANVKELMAILKTSQLNEHTLSEWLEETKLISAQDEVSDKDKVKIMTIHAAKGLEFPAVFLIGLQEGVLPCVMAQKPDQLEEERRLFYVAITRPKKHLRMSYATSEFVRDKAGGSNREMRPSRYVKDIKDHVKFV